MGRKRIYIFLFVIVGILLMLIAENLIESVLPWKMPKSLVGEWASRQRVTIRFKKDGNYDFKSSPDSVLLHLTISENGSISGSFGSAMLKDCSVVKNKGLITKLVNFSSDLMISGKIRGAIFPDDTIEEIGIRAPIFKRNDNTIEATIYQSKGIDIFPMTEIFLTKLDFFPDGDESN